MARRASSRVCWHAVLAWRPQQGGDTPRRQSCGERYRGHVPRREGCRRPGERGQGVRMHGIVSLLDQRHAAQVAAVWASLQDRLGLQSMDVPPFPHVSYHVAEQYEGALLEPIVRAFAALSAGIIEYYHPDQWVPHITLHHGNLSADALAEAVRLLSQRDFTWRLRLDNLTLLAGDGETPQHHVQYQYPLTGTR